MQIITLKNAEIRKFVWSKNAEIRKFILTKNAEIRKFSLPIIPLSGKFITTKITVY